jgi:hypothetical protein
MTNFEIGQNIRSYDFISRTDCYIEGVITNICNGLIEFDVTKSISEGREYADRPASMQTADIGNDFSDRMYNDLGRQRIEII